MNRTSADVAVAGSGLLGLATAFELLRRGMAVTVIGPRTGEHDGQASRAAGAMLTVFSEVESTHDPARVQVEVGERLAALAGYQEWLASVTAASGRPLALVPGVWVVANAVGADDAAELAAIASAAAEHGHPAEMADPSEVTGLSPQRRAWQALWLPTEASIDAPALTAALAAAVSSQPRCAWTDALVTGVWESGGQLLVSAADGSTTAAAHVVLAAGAAIPAVLGDGELVDRVAAPPLWSGRGISLLLQAPFPVPAAIRTPNRGFACGSHLVPRCDGRVYLGGTNRLSTRPDYDRGASLDEVATLVHDGSAELNTGLRDAALLGVRVGHRPVTTDHLPLLGRTGHPMVHLATGTYRCGVLLAPRAAQIVADGVTDPGRHDRHPYSPRRAMPAPTLGEVLAGSVGGLVEMLCQPAGQLPAGAAAELERFLQAALAELASGTTGPAAAVKRLWRQAPVRESVPLLLKAAARAS
jgi:glycine/D-amino acid oxidase-like deaminating enzyme